MDFGGMVIEIRVLDAAGGGKALELELYAVTGVRSGDGSVGDCSGCKEV